MPDSLSNASEKLGMPPGSLIHVGDVLEAESRISVIDYDHEHLEESSIQSVDELLQFRKKETVTWVNIEGLKNVELTELIGQHFHIHPLVLEDILNTHQRPKFEEYDNYLYIVLKGLSLETDNDSFSVNHEQISILLFDEIVFTFKEKKDDMFLPLIQRIRSSTGRVRSLGTDYLTYTILDTIVDQNFVLLDSLDVKIDSVEDELLSEPTTETLVMIQRIKRELIDIRRSISPLRELLSSILRSDTKLIHEKTRIYFRDVFDHALRITETIDSYRDMLSGLLDIYISSVSNKMNEVMKVLTLFASIFIPLSFIAGIYGMNFENMPVLKWRWGYPAIWGVFITVPICLILFFKKKKWL
ncbi:magnesium/cobalt transporter CorA [Gimesia aquarii]|uniref:Magnesium transport protein CorA n=1 Tax=Gimesia aquarii TaxID=2527964 RepID=A0A517VZS7_9PLAN|nr:magnesium/cobalt transporter CorA [Gimesia aquarii]QDT98507.1 Magnesium transport protein CorA [Gimesia aquarii]